MDDRLLHYQQPTTPSTGGFSGYGILAFVAAVVGLSVMALAGAHRLPDSLEPLVIACVAFCAGVTFFGILLAAMDRRNWRTLMWLGIAVGGAASLLFVAVTGGYIRL